MSALKDYDIKFAGLKLGEHSFDFQLSDSFFDLFDYRDYSGWDIEAKALMLKKSNSLELELSIEGQVKVHCDLTNEPFMQKIANGAELLVKFGNEYDDTSDEVLILPEGEHQFNIAQYLYELAALSIPLKKVHPDVESGKTGKEMLKKIQSLSPENNKDQSKSDIDPRWDKLKTLLK